MHRPTVGAIALVLLAGWLALLFGEESLRETFDLDQSLTIGLQAACIRVGLVMAAIWLAHPQLNRLPGWTAKAILLGAIVIAWRPKIAIVVLPMLLAYFVLRPRKRADVPPRARPRERS